MERNKSKVGKVLNFILTVVLLIVLYYAYQYYQSNNFNDFVKSEVEFISEFKRDKEIKYGDRSSYRIRSEDFNDAMFYKSIDVKKNTPYKVTCMVKTNQVEAKYEAGDEIVKEDYSSEIGAHISIEGTTEKSVAVNGTQDWQKIELMFNSKDRESVNIGFRLGGYLGRAKGEAWFSDFTLEEGLAEKNNEWKFGCFIFETTDVQIDGKEIKVEVTNQDMKDIEDTINRFQRSCSTISEGKMSAQCDIYKVETPLTSLSYDETFGYYVTPKDVEMQLKETLDANDYDHIFVILRLRK